MSDNLYFTVRPTKGGVTNQLLQFMAFYKLGRSLGWTYLHRPFLSPRSSTFSVSGWPESPAGKGWRRVRSAWTAWRTRSQPEIYDFLGVNDYLAPKLSQKKIDRMREIDLQLGDTLLDNCGVEGFEPLREFVADFVARRVRPGDLSLVVFSLLPGRRSFFVAINQAMPTLPPELDLRQAYREARRDLPWPSRYPSKGKIKLAVHIRQGDTAIVKTPWNSYILAWNKNKQQDLKYLDSPDLRDFRKARVLQVDDFYRFLRELTQRFARDAFSLLVLSDGFERAFAKIGEKIDGMDLTAHQVRAFRRSQRSYDRVAFRQLRALPNAACIIGESPGKLCDLFHSLLLADVVVLGTQQKLVPKFVASHCTRDNQPVLIVLHRGGKPSFRKLALKEENDKLLYFDLDNPDYDALSRDLVAVLDRKSAGIQLGGDA